MSSPRSYTIRLAGPKDARALRDLAQVDSQSALTGAVLVAAFDDDGIAAAIAMEDGRVIADPFQPTAGLVSALRITRGNHVRSSTLPGRRDRAIATLLRPAAAQY